MFKKRILGDLSILFFTKLLLENPPKKNLENSIEDAWVS
jgi:hypothetical protein